MGELATGEAVTTKRPYFGGGRKPSGTLVQGKAGFSAKIWTPCARCAGAACPACGGKGKVRVTKPLGTDNRRVAKARLARLMATENPGAVDTTEPETFADAAKRIIEQQRDEDGVKTWA